MEVQFNDLVEATLSDIHRKHRSVKMLFPTFDDRVKNVQLMGGIRLKEVDDDNWHFSVHSGTKKDVWYDCTLHFKNIQEVLEHYVKDRRLWVEDRSRVDLKRLASVFIEKVDVQVFCSCLTGDTMIPLLDGRHLTMEQILSEFGTDKEFWVFASDENGDFVPAKATCLGKTNEVNELVEVTLDNDETVKCTTDHLFRMRDGSYTRADQLKPGDSLMPLYTRKTKPNKKYSQSYLQVRINSKKSKNNQFRWRTVHRVVAETMMNDEMLGKESELVDAGIEKHLSVHHKNFNALDNTPENLEWLGEQEHWMRHANIDRTNAINGSKAAWADPEKRQERLAEVSRAGKACKRKHPDLYEKFLQGGIDFMKSDEGRKFSSELGKKVWAEKRNHLVQKLKDYWSNPENRELASKRAKEGTTDSIRSKISNAATKVGTKKVAVQLLNEGFSRADIIGAITSIYLGLGREFDVARRNAISCVSNVLSKVAVESSNHSVKSVRLVKLVEKVPVYDLSVDGYSNFAVSAGVFVHNCPAFLYYGPSYILGRPKYDAKYTDPEHRPPNKRNPKQYGAVCKHYTNVLKALPFYVGTIAKWLRDFYARDIAGYEKEAMREFGWLRKAATVLGKKKARVEKKPVKAPEKKPEAVRPEAEEKDQTQPETKGSVEGEKPENERITEAKDEQYEWFVSRTNKHIGLVKNAAKKIAGVYPEFEDLLKQVGVHDASKLEEPEKTPYVLITWRHKLENERGEFDPINNKRYQTPGLLAKEDENTAILHHITTNSHHPEYHLKNKQDANINSKDRDKSNSCVDATAMPDLDIAEMVADWQAMSEELGKNTSRQWFNKQKDVRWHFSAKQEQLIDGLLRVFEAVVDESISIRLIRRLLESYRI